MSNKIAGRQAALVHPTPPGKGSDNMISKRSVVGLKEEYPAGYVSRAHSHAESQLLFASSGVMSIVTDTCIFAVPPQRALWIQAGIEHEVTCRNRVSIRTLYLEPGLVHDDGQHFRLFEVSHFLKTLILEIVNFSHGNPTEEKQLLATKLLLLEIDRMPLAPYRAPMPQTRRIFEACRTITCNLKAHVDLDDVAEAVNMSRRSFTRLFRHETGMSFGAWLRHMRMTEAISMIESGMSIKRTSYELGYKSPSAFTAAFHKVFNLPPSQYRF